ncbi:hypothetical protein [Azospirillum sp. B4]|uniref:hypothetical protein n=1 Tax=Azospirillum sp. B4 TaxID=95605 RepID=UPI0003486D98|nr:hypothetical protein [Azospirillum sp. B4]
MLGTALQSDHRRPRADEISVTTLGAIVSARSVEVTKSCLDGLFDVMAARSAGTVLVEIGGDGTATVTFRETEGVRRIPNGSAPPLSITLDSKGIADLAADLEARRPKGMRCFRFESGRAALGTIAVVLTPSIIRIALGQKD